MVSEILGSENAKLIDFLFGKGEEPESEESTTTKQAIVGWEPLLPKLFSILERDTICMTAAGYFNKAIITIIRKRGYDVGTLSIS